MNQVILIGRLSNDPELSYTPNNQTAVCRFNLAVSRMRREDPADFIRITVWGKQAENCNKFLAKGRQAAVHGRIQTGSYDDKEGKKVFTTEVVANSVEFLGSGNGGAGNSGNHNSAPESAPTEAPMEFEEIAEDIPF